MLDLCRAGQPGLPGLSLKIGLRVLAYLANTKGIRLSLVPNESSSMSIYTDASFAPFSERSITGVVVMMCSCCVIWKSRRQTLVSLSTAECELIAAIEGIVLGQSVEALIKELWDDPVKLTLHVDNTAAIALAEGGGSQRTRHLRVRACYLRDQLEQNHLEVLHCPGEVQLADALTKGVASSPIDKSQQDVRPRPISEPRPRCSSSDDHVSGTPKS